MVVKSVQSNSTTTDKIMNDNNYIGAFIFLYCVIFVQLIFL